MIFDKKLFPTAEQLSELEGFEVSFSHPFFRRAYCGRHRRLAARGDEGDVAASHAA